MTYDDEHLPQDYGLHPEDLQKFWKRLRKTFDGDRRIKYYACGEYGDKYGRPHYHAIVFGVDDKDFMGDGRDKRIFQANGSYNLNSSLWPCGFINVGSVTDESIQYVAGYINKKLGGDAAKEKYGECYPPFARMSQGIGKQWFLENQIPGSDTVRFHGKNVPIPRYYKKLRGQGTLSGAELDFLHLRQMAGDVLTMQQSLQRQLEFDYRDKISRKGEM